jgi:hypothetical protein
VPPHKQYRGTAPRELSLPAAYRVRGIGVVSLEKYEQLGGWTLIPARLDVARGQWTAIAEHDDGRTLFCSVPASLGPVEAEAGVRGMVSNTASSMPSMEPHYALSVAARQRKEGER